MIILIDGYNLLKQRDAGIYIENHVREKFIRLLGAYHKRRGHAIVLIFDGGPSLKSVQEVNDGIVIVYAGAGKSADDYIKQYIAKHRTQDLLLVSSDRELNHWAAAHAIASMDSMAFYGIITAAHAHKDGKKQAAGSVVKMTATENPSLDALMEEATAHMAYKEDDGGRHDRVRSEGHKESKIDRLLRKKIEKL